MPSVNAILLLLLFHFIHIIGSNSLLWKPLGTVVNSTTVSVFFLDVSMDVVYIDQSDTITYLYIVLD
jgi:hypothetical protein